MSADHGYQRERAPDSSFGRVADNPPGGDAAFELRRIQDRPATSERRKPGLSKNDGIGHFDDMPLYVRMDSSCYGR